MAGYVGSILVKALNEAFLGHGVCAVAPFLVDAVGLGESILDLYCILCWERKKLHRSPVSAQSASFTKLAETQYMQDLYFSSVKASSKIQRTDRQMDTHMHTS